MPACRPARLGLRRSLPSGSQGSCGSANWCRLGRRWPPAPGRAWTGLPTLEQALPLRAIGRVEAERDPVAPEQFAELMRSRGPLLADDTNRLQPGQVRSAPLVELLGDKAVKVLVRWRPGLDDVGIDITENGRPQDRLRDRLVAPGDEQHPPGSWVERPDPRQQLCRLRFRQP